jgi:hypothetical protein
VKLINGTVMVSLPWRTQYAHVSGVGDKREMLLKSILVFVLRVRYFCTILIKTEGCRQILIKLPI